MIFAEFEKAIVALTCLREMRGEGMNAMIAVAFVLRNRAKAGWHRSSPYLNAVAPLQFSSISVKGDPNTIWFGWFATHIANNETEHPRTAVIGRTVFYK